MKMHMVLAIPLLVSTVHALRTMQLAHRWKSPEFAFPDEETKRVLIASRKYVPNTGFILDVDRDRRGRTFVSLPSFSNGTTVTLATVEDNQQVDSPLLKPYPDWSWHLRDECDGLTSVFRTQIDLCDRLWAIDSGVIDIFGALYQACPPSLFVFDLNTDTLIKRYVFPEELLKSESLLINLAVEAEDCGQDAFVYIADVRGYRMIVYDFKRDRSWLVDNRIFHPDPKFVNFDIAGSQFVNTDGLFALTLSPKIGHRERVLYFHSLASNCESSVRTSVLKNEKNFEIGMNFVDSAIWKCFGTRSKQSAAEAMDSRGILFSSDLSDNAIDCWNWYTHFSEQQVEKSNKLLQFISGMKVISGQFDEEVWAISSRFQRFTTNTLDRNEYNFHIVKGSAAAMAWRCRPRWPGRH